MSETMSEFILVYKNAPKPLLAELAQCHHSNLDQRRISAAQIKWQRLLGLAAVKEQPVSRLYDAWNRLQEIVQNEYAGCTNLSVAMNDVAGAIAAEIVCRSTAKEQPGFQMGDPHPCDMTPTERKKMFDAPEQPGEQICPHCKGSGEGKWMTYGQGPDDYEIDIPCP